MRDKLAELLYLQQLVREKLSEDEITQMRGRIMAKFICTLAKYLIKDAGYARATKAIQRGLRKIGEEDAKRLMRIFKLKEKTPQNASRILKIAAMILGLKLDVVEDETIIRNCPQGKEALKLKEPLMCKVCSEYCKGIIEGIIGKEFELKRIKSLVNGNKYCMFRIVKR
jgi:predicted hydrocarbon binding protein